MKQLWDYLKVSCKIELENQLVFRSNFFVSILSVVIRVAMLLALWSALYQGKTQVNGISLATMKCYTVVSIVFELFIASRVEQSVTGKVKDGSISMVLTRPASYPATLFIEHLAGTFQAVVMWVVPYLLVIWLCGLTRNVELYLGPWFWVSVAGAYLLMFFYQLFFGMIAFWTQEISGFLQARDAVMLVFSGSMVPLWFFPDWLFSAAQYLPFQAMYSTPLSIMIGKIAGPDIYTAVLIQAGWILGFWLLAQLCWRKSRRRMIVNGG